MNQDVPQPTTATRSPIRGSSAWERAATSTALLQQRGCEPISLWMKGSRSMGTRLLERGAGQAGLDLPVEEQVDDHHGDHGDGEGGEQRPPVALVALAGQQGGDALGEHRLLGRQERRQDELVELADDVEDADA